MAVIDKKERTDIIRRFASGLRFPYLFILLLILFAVDLFIPDPIPFIDEAILGLLAVLVGTWKDRKKLEPEQEPEMKNVTPRD
jgi:hypothetical protein